MSATPALPRKILVTVDGSEESQAAALYSIELAKNLGAQLTVLHVILLPEYVSSDVAARLERELTAKGEQALSRVRKAAQAMNVTIHEKMLTTTKSVVTTIVEYATTDQAQLIIVGTKGIGGVAQLMLGSVATGVAREARVPVLVVR